VFVTRQRGEERREKSDVCVRLCEGTRVNVVVCEEHFYCFEELYFDSCSSNN